MTTPNSPLPPSPAHTFHERAQYCRQFLVVNGFMVSGENEYVLRRIKRWLNGFSMGAQRTSRMTADLKKRKNISNKGSVDAS